MRPSSASVSGGRGMGMPRKTAWENVALCNVVLLVGPAVWLLLQPRGAKKDVLLAINSMPDKAAELNQVPVKGESSPDDPLRRQVDLKTVGGI